MLIKTKSRMREHFHERCIAYNKIFDKQNQFLHVVMNDLTKFCRAEDSTFHTDSRVAAMLDGRRQVFLRIQEFLSLNADQMLEKYTKEISSGGDDEGNNFDSGKNSYS